MNNISAFLNNLYGWVCERTTFSSSGNLEYSHTLNTIGNLWRSFKNEVASHYRTCHGMIFSSYQLKVNQEIVLEEKKSEYFAVEVSSRYATLRSKKKKCSHLAWDLQKFFKNQNWDNEYTIEFRDPVFSEIQFLGDTSLSNRLRIRVIEHCKIEGTIEDHIIADLVTMTDIK